ncbi:FecCD family ABC transporter permease [Ammoniphilus resinae]|uniref:Iron complex transport system permease protein n=1 Tax=Ammoniphilus resinae TaxID=861532 RepID=A0ABS4GU57_9BACL|nr:iron ABC transporter permease [Ammoniphilus resinae]MBP1933811.1 iron complex transport system permease protein [Ammoniphilus resinae]
MTFLFSTRILKIIGILIGVFLLIFSGISSILFGLTDISWEMVLHAYTNFDGSNEQLIIKTSRVPRMLVAIAVGVSSAIAGALMQALSRNPLAAPDIFGLNAGASFFIVFSVAFLGTSSLSSFIWIAFLGAGISALAIYLLGSVGRNGLTPMKLTLAGASIAALFSSLTKGILTLNEKALDEVLFWLAGSVEGRKLEMLFPVLPFMIFAWLASFFMAKQVNTLAMGEDVAKGLGQRTIWVKTITWMLIVLLAGSSVAVAGPIGFIGIVIPHIARAMVGIDHRWIIPYCAILGAILLLLADIGARFVIMPKEVPVGVMTALVGTPFFIYIARKGFSKS